MDIQKKQEHRNTKEGKDQPERKLKKGEKVDKKQKQVLTSPPSPPSTTATSSPSHEFSFTISLNSSPTQPNNDKTRPHQHSSLAIDLSPADEIFFHGHLLPLHLLSHLPVSPHSSSSNSLDSFTLPIKELVEEQIPNKQEEICSTSHKNIENDNHHRRENISETNGRSKHRSFSMFGWRKGCEVREKVEEKGKHKRKLSFDVSQVLKRYVRMVRPLLFFRGRRDNTHFQRQAYSFSDSFSWRNNRQEFRGRRGEFSAPASMRNSPGNSGLLLPIPSSASDSTMEELQAAIQAAIAHCKNSIAAHEKIKTQTT